MSILTSAVYLIMGQVFSAVYILVAVFGLICGGIVPAVMIVRGRIDTSEFFLGKMILFAAVQKTDLITKICLALSSLVWAYLGFLLEFLFVEDVVIETFR